MRTGFVVVAAAMTMGCSSSSETDGFAYRSTLQADTKGLVLHADGQRGHAGMFETNCPFETVEGNVTGDYDLPDRGEELQDAGPSHLGDLTVLAVIEHDLHFLNKFPEGNYTTESWSMPSLRQARLFEGGVVSLAGEGACELAWNGFDTTLQGTVSAPCGLDMDASPVTGDVAIVDADGLHLRAVDDAFDVATPGDLVSWDRSSGVIYVAKVGENEVTAVQADGTVRWTIDAGDGVVALSHAGTRGAAAVVLEKNDGTGTLAYFDAADGALVAVQDTPQPALDVTTSEDGHVVAMVRPGEVHFYGISKAE